MIKISQMIKPVNPAFVANKAFDTDDASSFEPTKCAMVCTNETAQASISINDVVNMTAQPTCQHGPGHKLVELNGRVKRCESRHECGAQVAHRLCNKCMNVRLYCAVSIHQLT